MRLIFHFFVTASIYLVTCITAVAQQLPSNSVPAMWLDERNLILVSEDEIFQYDVDLKFSVKIFYKADKNIFRFDSNHFCFDNNRWLLRVKKTDDSIATLLLDPSNLKAERLIGGFSNFNNFDCTPESEINKNAMITPVPEISFHNKKYSFFRFAPRGQLIKSSDGEAYIYGNSDSFLISASNSKGVDKKILLSGSNHQNIADFTSVNSAYDKVNNLYLWYPNTSHFLKSQNSWPLKGWWISHDLNITSDIDIPAGPWVVDKASGDCVECASHMKIYVHEGKIFAKIFGENVAMQNRGVYQLLHPADSENAFWKKIIDEVKSDISISPSGCKIAYATEKNGTKITDICQYNAMNL